MIEQLGLVQKFNFESNSHQVEIQDDVIVSGIVTANGFVGPLEVLF